MDAVARVGDDEGVGDMRPEGVVVFTDYPEGICWEVALLFSEGKVAEEGGEGFPVEVSFAAKRGM